MYTSEQRSLSTSEKKQYKLEVMKLHLYNAKYQRFPVLGASKGEKTAKEHKKCFGMKEMLCILIRMVVTCLHMSNLSPCIFKMLFIINYTSIKFI